MSYFFIKSKLTGFVMDITAGNLNAGTAVIVWPKDEKKDNQKWRFDDGTKTIRSKLNENLVLDIQEDDTLIINNFDLSRHDQHWTRVNGDRLLNVDDNRFCIDVFDSDESEGARVIKYPYYGTTNQHWEFESVEPPRQKFFIRSKMHWKAIAVNGNALEIQPKSETKDAHQLFYADKNGYLFSSVNDLALQAARGDQFTLGAPPDSEKWKFSGDKIVRGAGLVMDIQGGMPDDGVHVVAWDDKGQVNQEWSLDNI